MTEPPFCSALSAAADEPLYGTAATETTWILLEVRGEWRAKAATDNDLPAPVQAALARALEAIPGSRLLFIRQERRAADRPLCLFIARVGGPAPVLRRIELDRYEDLPALDLPAIAGQPAGAGQAVPGPLFTLCTNGKRDRCCALHGPPLYQALREAVAAEQGAPGAVVWQSTHVGGHRFAATVLVFPDGINYGRLAPDQAAELLAAQAEKRLLLRHLRGRVGLDPVAQAADFFLRTKTEADRLDRFQWRDSTPLDRDEFRVRFDDTMVDVTHAVFLRYWLSTAPQPVSCDGSLKPVPRFRFLRHQMMT